MPEIRSDLSVVDVHKSFGTFKALDGVRLEAQKGEFLVLLGPSGCGKSTLLRTIAGLETPDRGEVFIGGKPVNHQRPKDRNVAMVFQNYALYPFMTVAENIGFGLRMRGISKEERLRAVRETAGFLGIETLLDRYPRQLSGGQRQRVAMGRATVRHPTLFLFDEPLSNLDAQLRDDMRTEIKRLHRGLGTTAVYVTHDQIEAMTMADRIILLKDGKVEQVGSPLELYRQPTNLFVASFIGSPKINILRANLILESGEARLDLGEIILSLPAEKAAQLKGPGRQAVVIGIRPESIGLATGQEPAGSHHRFFADVTEVEPTGARLYADFKLSGSQIRAELAPSARIENASPAEFCIDLDSIHIFDAESEVNLALPARNGRSS